MTEECCMSYKTAEEVFIKDTGIQTLGILHAGRGKLQQGLCPGKNCNQCAYIPLNSYDRFASVNTRQVYLSLFHFPTLSDKRKGSYCTNFASQLMIKYFSLVMLLKKCQVCPSTSACKSRDSMAVPASTLPRTSAEH